MKIYPALLSISFFIFITSCDDSITNTEKEVAIDKDAMFTTKQHYTFIPPVGKTLLFIGQDSDTISAYVNDVPEDNIEGVTLYTQIKHKDPTQTLFAVLSPADWQSGEMSFTKTLSESPNAALAVGLALDKCNQADHELNIATGEYDQSINFMIDHFKSLAPRKVFLRIGYEFDGPWNCYTPDNYKSAFRHIAKMLDNKGAHNVTTVWQSATWPDSYGNPIYDFNQENHLTTWYPGDDVVDWVAMSVFYRDLSQWNYTPPTTPAESQEKTLAFARKHNKPVMIAEAAPQGYRIGALTQSVIQQNDQTTVSAEDIWQNWYQPFFDFIDNNKDVIRAVAYINTHWETQAMWECQPNIQAGQPGCNGGNWGDSRVQANSYIKEKWLEQITNSNRWVQTSQY